MDGNYIKNIIQYVQLSEVWIREKMKKIINFGIFLISSIWIFSWLIYGYGSIINEFDLKSGYDILELFQQLKIFNLYIFILYIISCITLLFCFKKKTLFIDKIAIITVLIFLYQSFNLFWNSLNRYYIKEPDYEVNSFLFLINDYGSIVHIFYISPLIFSVVYAFFVFWLYFKFRSKNINDNVC